MVDPCSGNYDNLPHVGPGNIESFTGRLYDNVNTVKDDALISGKFHFDPGDIIYGKINPQLGKYTYAQFEGLASADAYVLNGKNGLTQEFLFGILQTKAFFDYSVSVSMRSGMPKINRGELNAFEFLAPNESEQRAIGDILLKLDDLITLHQRKRKYRGLYGYLSWEQRKLGDCVGSTYGGGTPSTSHDEYWGGDIPWIQSSNVLENELFRIDIPKAITQDGLSKSAALQVPGDSIAVVTHVGVGKLVYLPFPYATSQDFVSLSGLKGDANFLCYAIHRKLQSELHMVQGSAIKGITKEELLGKAISLPAAEEQKLIGNQMRAIDNLITLHQ